MSSSTVDLTNAQWRKSSYSGGEGGDCVEVALIGGTVAVRDSKNPSGPALTFTPAAFTAFVDGITADELNQI